MNAKLNRVALNILVVSVLLLSALSAPNASAQKGDDGIRRDYNAQTGKVTHITGAGGEPVMVASAMENGMDAMQRSDALVYRFAPEFGLTQPQEELRLADEAQPSADRVVTRYQQVYNGIPVIAGELIVNASDKGALHSMNGEVAQGLSLDTAPSISSETAIAIARQGMVKWYGGEANDYEYADVSLWIFDETLLKPSHRTAELVWRMELTPSDQLQPIRELVLVNAETGNISLHFNQVDTGWGQNPASKSISVPYQPSTPINTEPHSTTDHTTLLQSGSTWYVATTGNDANNCSTTSTPCATIQAAIDKSSSGDTILVTTGIFAGIGSVWNNSVIQINKNLILSGGWDPSYSTQTSYSTIDGEGVRRGVYVSPGVVTIDHFIISNGSANGGAGLVNGGTLTINNSSISNNTAFPFSGAGGIANSPAATLTINNSTINGNSAHEGGGIHNNGGTLILNNSTVGLNFATDRGAGIYNNNTSVFINNSTIVENHSMNSSGGGGGIYNSSGSIQIQNSILAKNTNAYSNGHDCKGNISSVGYNIIGVSSGCSFLSTTGDHVDVVVGLGTITGQPGYYLPTPTSIAIDAGNPNGCKDQNGNLLITDQRGEPRPQGPNCDIGSVEMEYSTGSYTFNTNNSISIPGILTCGPSEPTCTNGADQHADWAHIYTSGTYDLYLSQHNRNSIDNAGMPMVSTVHYDLNYANAFWNGEQTVYGDYYGFPLADDVVAHELTHGVTQYESDLFYYYQSGAINESFSDLWGEYYDQTNSSGNDTASAKWLVGEDVSGYGAFRSMSNPPSYGDPDKMTSSLYNKKPYYDDYWDNGGVHSNSGVNNKAVFLMVDGGTFNAKTVTSLGWDKIIQIYYEAQTNLLSSGSDYSDLYYALQQACTNLTGQYGITAADCLEVKDALDAVLMNSQPAANFNPDAPFCPTGMSTVPLLTLFEDDLEGGTGNWVMDSQWSLEDDYVTSPIYSLYGNDDYEFLDSHLTLTTSITLPSGAFLHFKHAFLLDYYGSNYYDGGVLEYSVDGGTNWNDAKPLFSAGKNYGPNLKSGFGNPLEGRPAFTGDSHGYVSSRYNLSTLAGQTVQFRWRLATDNSFSALGWFLDDVKIYTCVGTASTPTLLLPKNNALVTDYTPLLDWEDSTATDHYELQISSDANFTSLVYNETSVPASQFDVPTDLASNTKFYWRVRAVNGIGQPGNWSTAWNFRTALLPPTLVSPADGFTSLELRPPFDWDDVASATGYTIQFSKNATFTQVVHTGNPVGSSYTPTADLPKNLTLYWRVQTKGANGPSGWSEVRSFESANSPSTPTLSQPAGNALIKDYLPLFKWTAATLPAGSVDFLHYQLQVDDNSDFSSPELDDASITDRMNVIFQTVTPFAPNTKFYWRVRAVNVDNEVSNWSVVRSFRTVVDAPTLVSPNDGFEPLTLRPDFDWDTPSGPAAITGYTIQISKNNTFTQIVHTGNPTTSNYTPTADLVKNTLLYWRVQAKGANGPSAWSEVRSFTSANSTAAPVLVSPANNALITNNLPLLTWKAVTLPSGADFLHYQVQVDDTADFSSPVVDDTSITARLTVQLQVGPLASNTKFYWRVRAVNDDNEVSNWSVVRYFRTIIPAPTLLTPADASVVGSLKPTFDWSDATGPGAVTGYTIQVSTSSTFSSLLVNATTVASTYTPVKNLPTGKTLYWRVRINGANGPSPWTGTFSFTINP